MNRNKRSFTHLHPSLFSVDSSAFDALTQTEGSSPQPPEENNDKWKEIVSCCQNLISCSSKAINYSSLSSEEIDDAKKYAQNISQLLTSLSGEFDTTGQNNITLRGEAEEKLLLLAQNTMASQSEQFSPSSMLPQSAYPSWRRHPSFPFEANYQTTEVPKRENKEGKRKCHSCNTTTTPEWRKGPDGPKTLCNACGLRYSKRMKRISKATDSVAHHSTAVNTVITSIPTLPTIEVDMKQTQLKRSLNLNFILN